MTTALLPLSLFICPCLSFLSTEYCLRPCCHTLRRCSLTARTLCFRREEWDYDPPAVTTRNAYWRLTPVDCINRVSIRSLEMSFEQDQLEHLDTSAASKDSSRSAGVPESKGGSTEPPSTSDPAMPILFIWHRFASIVHRELGKMEGGEIDELSEQHNNMLQQLASLNVSNFASVTLSESDRSNPVPTQPVPTYAWVLSAPKVVTFTPNDVRSLPRLTGSTDVDVTEVLSLFRLAVGVQANAVAPNDEHFADNLAFSICHSSAMVLVLRCVNNLCQVGLTGVRTLSTPRTLRMPVRLPRRPPGKSSN